MTVLDIPTCPVCQRLGTQGQCSHCHTDVTCVICDLVDGLCVQCRPQQQQDNEPVPSPEAQL